MQLGLRHVHFSWLGGNADKAASPSSASSQHSEGFQICVRAACHRVKILRREACHWASLRYGIRRRDAVDGCGHRAVDKTDGIDDRVSKALRCVLDTRAGVVVVAHDHFAFLLLLKCDPGVGGYEGGVGMQLGLGMKAGAGMWA